MEALNLDGLVAAAVTPMTATGEVNYGLISEIVAHYERNGVVGIYILGSTGEGMSLTDEERLRVAEHFVEATAGRMKTFLQVGHSSLQTSIQLAKHGEQIGVDAISATPPGYFKPENEAAVVTGLEEITSAVPELPFYYYHIPYLSGVSLNPILLTRIANERLPNFVGIKYSDPATLYNLPLLEAIDPRLEFFSGADEAYLQCLAQGYKAAIGSTYGFATPIFHQVSKAFEAGNLEQARLWQGRALQMIDTIFSTCGRGGLKAMMAMVDIDCGPSRWPISRVSAEQMDNLRRSLDTMGWFDWVGTKQALAV